MFTNQNDAGLNDAGQNVTGPGQPDLNQPVRSQTSPDAANRSEVSQVAASSQTVSSSQTASSESKPASPYAPPTSGPTQPWELSTSPVVVNKPVDSTAVADPYPAETAATMEHLQQLREQEERRQREERARREEEYLREAGVGASSVQSQAAAAQPVMAPASGSAPATAQPGTAPSPQAQAAPLSQAASSAQNGAAAVGPMNANPYASQASPAAPKKKRRVLAKVTSFFLFALLVAGLVVGGMYYLRPTEHQADAPAPAAPITQTPKVTASTDAPDWVAVAKAVRPAVVAIQVNLGSSIESGSGVIFDDQAHILTNHHVIAGGNDDNITISLVDGRVYKASVVGSDPTTDLAVLKLQSQPKDLTKATLGTSKGLQVGQPVAAVGNPLGLASTMTTGIISAIDRPVMVQQTGGVMPMGQNSDPVITNAIQVDASVNPGNSGGPLFDASGSVIGINSSIATINTNASGTTGGSIGLGFAIPIDLAKNVAQQLIQHGSAQHAFIGVMVGDGTAKVGDEVRTGAYINRVVAGSPAAKAGLAEGDVVTQIDGMMVGSGQALTGYVRRYMPGDQVTLKVARPSGVVDVKVTLGKK